MVTKGLTNLSRGGWIQAAERSALSTKLPPATQPLPQNISDLRGRVGRTAAISERTWNFWFKTRGHHFAHLDIIRISNLYERALALAKE